MAFATPLRYPGGKGRLASWLAETIRYNDIKDGWYIEPYAGGAGAAILLLVGDHVDRIVINDIDPVVHAFWWSMLNDAESLLEMIHATPVTMEQWEKQKLVHAKPEEHSKTEVGFATFFLNRTNRSGILAGGVIGGKKQDGKYLMDARYNKEDLAGRIKKISSLRHRIELYSDDAVELIKKLGSSVPKNSLFYFDPPYYNKGSQLYRNHYKPDDHASVASVVQDLERPWVVTYDDCDPIRKLYSKSSSKEFGIYYSTHNTRPRVKEVMFYGNVKLPGAPTLKR